ncbi:FAD:protein FMN transferase [Stratiformator vulcanicus]|uniref:FAD:protein FMN transferase n=1 Tax=Stratiformator vulcanicus TaxID=2527980 RepID=A0A517R0E7_9PLAN|nr:FAD:protein FMN transferase [Stratiformator vulcanicus]QDT37304.1 Thiamine biosynthesis lipoprotein ApbE precursor [Stratiformator vulcanicus]
MSDRASRGSKPPADHGEQPASRRGFLRGDSARNALEAAQEQLADEVAGEESLIPTAGPTVRLSTQAMACEFSVVMNPGPASQVMRASDALDLVHVLEQKMTVYRDDADLVRVNEQAADGPVPVDEDLFEVLALALELCEQSDGAFDPTSGRQIDLWRRCRAERRLPTQRERDEVLAATGCADVALDREAKTVRFRSPQTSLNLGAIGKGFALDRAAEFLAEQEVDDFLLHGGHSSVAARGSHAGHDGWPVGIGNPLLTSKRFGTILLKDRAMSTSGSNIQYFRHEGRKYGHLLDPRTAMPTDGLLSVVVTAPSAALADALSTAFFVMGVEKAQTFCNTYTSVGAILIPPPTRGGRLDIVSIGIPDENLFLDTDQLVCGSD